MMTFNTYLMLILSLLGVSLAQANDHVLQEPLDWQKVRLETKIQDLLKADLSQFLDQDEFVVHAKVSFSPPKENEVAKNKLIPENADESEELIYLDRLGLWSMADAPALPGDSAAKPLNLFEHIKTVSVQVLIDKGVSENKKEVVKSIVDQHVSDFGKKANIDIKAMDLKTVTPPKVWSVYDWLDRFSIPIGLVVSVLMFMLFFMIYVSKNQKIENKKIQIMESQAQATIASMQSSSSPEVTLSADSSAGNSGSSESKITQVDSWKSQDFPGIQQFRKLLQTNTANATLLIRQWLNAGSEDTADCLSVLGKSDFVDEIVPLIEFLSIEERKKWRGQLNRSISSGVVEKVDEFLSRSVFESILVPPPPVKKDASDLLAGISPEECVHVAKTDAVLGGVLANTLKAIQVARMFALMDEDTVKEVSEQGVTFDESKLDEPLDKIQKMVIEYRENSKVFTSPFIEKSVDLIREVGPSKESFIFDAIAKSGDSKTLTAITNDFFPSELVLELPEELLKKTLSQLPATGRAELIFIQEEGFKNKLLTAIGETGKARELIDVEIAEISSNEIRSKKLENQKEKIWTHFVRINRQMIKADESFRDQVSPLLDNWIKTKLGASGHDVAEAS